MNKSDLTILIQGPLNTTSLDNLIYYKSLGQVIISYWDTCKNEILANYNLDGIICVRRPLPQAILKGAGHYGTFTKQIVGVTHGLQMVNTPYVVRVRSDELWCNLSPLIEKFELNFDKIVCGSIFFKKWCIFNYHLGDHLFIGKTKTLLNGFLQILKDLYYDKIAEAIISFGILDSLGLEKNKESFIRVFDVIDINLLSPFIARWNQQGVTYINKFEDQNCIMSMEDL